MWSLFYHIKSASWRKLEKEHSNWGNSTLKVQKRPIVLVFTSQFFPLAPIPKFSTFCYGKSSVLSSQCDFLRYARCVFDFSIFIFSYRSNHDRVISYHSLMPNFCNISFFFLIFLKLILVLLLSFTCLPILKLFTDGRALERLPECWKDDCF